VVLFGVNGYKNTNRPSRKSQVASDVEGDVEADVPAHILSQT